MRTTARERRAIAPRVPPIEAPSVVEEGEDEEAWDLGEDASGEEEGDWTMIFDEVDDDGEEEGRGVEEEGS